MQTQPYKEYMDQLIQIIEANPILDRLFDVAEEYMGHYYIGAGCITQTVWNSLSGFTLTYGIDDADIVYFDAHDSGGEKEKFLEQTLREQLHDIPFQVDVTNEARVHLWYHQKFGESIKSYRSVEEAMASWPTTASAIGIKRKNEQYDIYAPYGLHDLFDMVVRPNQLLVPKEVYEAKAKKWKERWPDLTVLSW